MLAVKIIALGQNKPVVHHTLDNCRKCYCYKWHKTIEIDSTDMTKVLFEYKTRRGSSSQCASDGYRKYKDITIRYYSNGKIKTKERIKGWSNGFTGEHKTTTFYFDKEGKKTKKVIDNSKKRIKALY